MKICTRIIKQCPYTCLHVFNKDVNNTKDPWQSEITKEMHKALVLFYEILVY